MPRAPGLSGMGPENSSRVGCEGARVQRGRGSTLVEEASDCKREQRDNDEPLYFQGLEEEEKDTDEGGTAPTGVDQGRRGAAEEEGPPTVGGGVPPKGGEISGC